MAETPQGSDLVSGTRTLVGDIKVARQLGVGGAVWLQKRTGKTFLELAKSFETEAWDMCDLQAILLALYVQLYDPVDEESKEFRAALHAINQLAFTDVWDMAQEVFAFEPKNSPSPEVDLTETTAPAE